MIPVSKLLISAILFVTLPMLVFFSVNSEEQLDYTSDLKNSTSEAIAAVAAILTAHFVIGYFIYTAYNIEVSKIRTD